MALSCRQRLGPYEIVGQIGAGGMGEVYRARHTSESHRGDQNSASNSVDNLQISAETHRH